MTGPSWFSESFPPGGASTAEGIRNQLGRPNLDLLTVLVRESTQNSWDARLGDRSGPVDYRIDLRTVGPAHAVVWRDLLQRNAPLGGQLPLRESLRRPSIRLMAISDRGTKGLGGPTRADNAVTKDHDFVSFVRNIGEPRDTECGGGTYGFGRGVFYLLSRPGTIIVHTRCRVESGYETRLIGCALWKSYLAQEAEGKRRYTGRHWWGDASGDVVEPLVGAEAEAMAQRLGLQPFKEKETGTTVVAIDPLLGEFKPADAATYLADTITWHLWPKMLETSTGMPAMRFTVTCDGIDFPVPDPRVTRPLDMFVTAYQRMAAGDGKALECRRPKQFLGRLGLEKRIAPALTPTPAAVTVGIESHVHHVCLLRAPELVVTYHPGPKPPSEHISYVGVFRADDALDETYAKAEPPTHDAWNPQSLEYPQITYVRTTFQRIKEALEGLLDLGGGVRGGSVQVALGAASSKFAPLVGGVWGTGGATDYGKPGDVRTKPHAGVAPSSDASKEDKGTTEPMATGTGISESNGGTSKPMSGGGPSSVPGIAFKPTRRRPRVEYVCEPYLDERSGIAVIVQPFRLPVPGRQRVHGDLAVALAGVGRETDPPLAADMPALMGWEDETGTLHAAPSHVIEGGHDSIWCAIVRPAADTMTEITIMTQSAEAAS